MGEIQRIEISLSPEATAEFARTVGALFGARAVPPAEVEPQAPPATPYDLGLEPWAFHSPHDRCDVVSYVDDRNQVRHVPVTRATEVPKAWRRVWLEPRE